MMAVTLGLASFVVVLTAADRGPNRRHIEAGAQRAIPTFVLIGVVLAFVAQRSLLVPVAFVVTAGMAHILFRSERARRRELGRLEQLPVVVEILARRISMGSTVRGALASLTERQRHVVGLAHVEARIRSGQGVTEALSEHTNLVGAALLVTEITGAANAAALERLADRLSSTTLDGRAAQSQAGQQLASAAVMSLLPPMVSVLYGLSDQRAAEFYLGAPLGSALVAASLLLSGAGWFWMRFITRPRPIT